MIELLHTAFVQRALLAGVMVGLLSSYYGAFVVQRRLSFLGDGLAHAAFGGVALGLLLGLEPLWIALPFTVAVAVGIVWVENRTRIAGDTAIGIFFATSMALGVIFLALRRSYSERTPPTSWYTMAASVPRYGTRPSMPSGTSLFRRLPPSLSSMPLAEESSSVCE